MHVPRGPLRIAVLGVVTAISCFVSIPGSAATPPIDAVTATEHATRTGNVHQIPVAPSRVTIIADSALTGIKTHGELGRLVGTQWDVRMQSCRRLVAPSCAYDRTTGAPTVLEVVKAIAQSGGATGNADVLLVATGHNDWDVRLKSDFVAIMDMARRAGFEKVAWTLYRDHFDPNLPAISQSLFAQYGRMNSILRAESASGQWPHLVLLGYDAFTRDHPDWFIPDGIHLTKDGATNLADWLSSVIRYDRTPALRP
jgi:hypothetical protein